MPTASLNILLNPIEAKNVLAHIRLATIGDLEFYNCHPFVKKDNSGRRWTLIHNGTVFDSQDLCKYSTIEEGETDSERILLAIIDHINDCEEYKGRPLNLKERFSVFSDLISHLSHNNKLNLIVHDGEQMYIHTNLKESLYYLKGDSSVLVSTKKLDFKDWKEVPLNKVFSFINGELLFESEAHLNEYVETEEQIRFIEKFIESLKADSNEEYAW